MPLLILDVLQFLICLDQTYFYTGFVSLMKALLTTTNHSFLCTCTRSHRILIFIRYLHFISPKLLYVCFHLEDYQFPTIRNCISIILLPFMASLWLFCGVLLEVTVFSGLFFHQFLNIHIDKNWREQIHCNNSKESVSVINLEGYKRKWNTYR